MVNIFFDLDGTLINSQHRLYNLFVELCPECKMTYDEYWEIKRQRINQKDFLKKYFNYSDEQCTEIHKLWLEKVEEPERLKQDFLVDGVVEVLEKLHNTPLPDFVGLPPHGGQIGKDICPPCGENGTKCQKGVELTAKNAHHQYYAPYIKTFARKMRKNMTSQEVKLWQYIRKEQLGAKFRRQFPISSKYIADFACLEKKIIIEIDGSQHLDNEDDKVRTIYLTEEGFRVIRFWNIEIDENINGCIEALIDLIDAPLPPSGTSPAWGADIPPTPAYAGTSHARGADMSMPEKWHEVPKEGKYNLYIVTNRQSKELTIKEIEALGIKKYFKDILVTEQKKTKEELIRENINFTDEDILIGDTGEDIKCAKAIGIKSIAVCWGILNENILKEYKPDSLVYNIKELSVKAGE